MFTRIKKASSEDAHAISLLGSTTFCETFKHCFRDQDNLAKYLSHTFSVAKITSSIAKENNVYWLAFADDSPVGYAKMKKQSASDFSGSIKSSQLQKIYVLKDFHKCGLGKTLLQATVSEAAKLGSDNLWLSVLESNDHARIFYEKAGFKPAGNHTFSIGKEEFYFSVMQLPL